MASGCNLWVWLECIGVVSGWCCKEVPYSGYFSRGINFRGFRGQLASAKN